MNTFKLNGDITENDKNIKDTKNNLVDNETPTENVCSLFFTCIKRILMDLKSKVSHKFFHLSFHFKLMIILVPLIIISGILLVMTHCIEYKEKFFSDYLEIYESYFLNKENIAVKFNEYEIKETLNKSFQNLIFWKIYAKEMISKNILNGEVFMNNTYSVYDNVLLLNEGNNYMAKFLNYTINFNDLCEGCDFDLRKTTPNSKDNLDNLSKKLIMYSPLLIQNDYFQTLNPIHIYLRISSISNNKNEDGVSYSYYPRRKGIYSKKIDFDPFPTDNNWFTSIHKEFKDSINLKSCIKMSTSYGNINRLGLSNSEEYIPILQAKILHENSTIILEFISKYSMRISSKNEYESFSFINLSYNLTQMTNSPVKRYVYDRVVFGNMPVIPITIPKIYQIYFREGMIPYDKSLQTFGYNSDVNDFTIYNKIDDKYQISFTTALDSLPYLMIYFYNTFYLKIKEDNIKFDKNDSVNEKFIHIIPPNENSRLIIKEVCNLFNFTHYVFNHYLLQHNTNCLAEENVSTYKIFNELLFQQNLEFIYGEENFYSVPECECLPFYCFDLNNIDNPVYSLENSITLSEFSDLKEKFIYADRIFLSKQCKLSFKNYKRSINPNYPKKFYLEFHVDKNGLIFNPNMTQISMYIIYDDKSQNLKFNFSSELKNFVLNVITIYSILSISFLIFFLVFVYKRSILIKNTIKEYAFNFDIKEEMIDNIKEKSNTEKFESYKKTSIIIPRNSSIYFNSNSMNNLPFDVKSLGLKASNIKILEKKRESRLDIIKENVEIENDESVLIDKKNFSSKKTLHIKEENIDNVNNNTYYKNEEKNINIITNYSNIHKKTKIKTIPNDEVIQELIFTNNSYISISENDLNSSKVQSELTKSFSLQDENIKKFLPLLKESENLPIIKKVVDNKTDILKTFNQIKLDDSFHFLNLDSFFLKLGEEDVNQNFFQNEYAIRKIEKKFYDKKKLINLLNNDEEDLEEHLFRIKENSKSLLSEIFSTEICKFYDLAFNFAFKYDDNEISLLDELNLKCTNEGMNSISIIDEYIDIVEANLKLNEKYSISDRLNIYFESEINFDDPIDISGNDLLKFGHIKSIVNYYLENILLLGLKKIYVEKYKDSFE